MNIQGAYTYEGITAELYDLWFHQESCEDRPFYQKHIKKNGGYALEIGSGTGRLLIPYLQNGLEVHGVEPSAQMIDICYEKAQMLGFNPTVHRQSMERLNIPTAYRTIYIPLCSFQLLVNRVDVVEALRRFYVHLEKGGELLISLFLPDLAHVSQGVWRVVRTTTRPTDQSQVILSEAIHNNRFEQVQTKWLKYEIYKDHRLIETFMKMMQLRWYHQYAFAMMLERAGFHDIRIYTDYSDDIASDGDELLIYSARK